MKNKIISSQLEVIKNLKLLSEQDEEYYKISPEELKQLLDYASNSSAVTKLPKFQGKKLYVTGDLDLSNRKELKSLGNIGYVDGKLDISRTNISDISNVIVKKYIWDSGTPIEQRRLKRELEEKRAIAKEREENDEWNLENPNIDELGLKANALYQYFIDNGDITELDDDSKEEYNSIKKQIEDLELKGEETDDMSVYSQILDEISELEDKLDEIGPKFTVYDLYPKKYKHYGDLTVFEVLHSDFDNREYTVGDDGEMDDAALEYSKNLIDDVGLDGFRTGFVEDYIDEEEVKQMFWEHYNDDVRENPESYFSDSDYELTDKQEKRIKELEDYISELDDYITEKENEQSELESKIEDPEEYSKAYDEIQEQIDEANQNKDDAQEEIDNMEPDKEPTEEMIDEKVDEIVDDMMSDPVRSLKSWGYEVKDYVDKDKLAQGLVESDGWGVMNGYDGQYDSVSVNNETFYVMRIN